MMLYTFWFEHSALNVAVPAVFGFPVVLVLSCVLLSTVRVSSFFLHEKIMMKKIKPRVRMALIP
jgi:hypothetical protein